MAGASARAGRRSLVCRARTSATFDEARGVLSPNPQRLLQETHMENRNGSAGSTLDSRLETIKESVKGLVDDNRERIKNRVIDAKQQAMARGNMYVDRVTDTIKTHPLKSVAIAFGVGYIGMRLFRR